MHTSISVQENGKIRPILCRDNQIVAESPEYDDCSIQLAELKRSIVVSQGDLYRRMMYTAIGIGNVQHARVSDLLSHKMVHMNYQEH